jgi:hypothetical protein
MQAHQNKGPIVGLSSRANPLQSISNQKGTILWSNPWCSVLGAFYRGTTRNLRFDTSTVLPSALQGDVAANTSSGIFTHIGE